MKKILSLLLILLLLTGCVQGPAPTVPGVTEPSVSGSTPPATIPPTTAPTEATVPPTETAPPPTETTGPATAGGETLQIHFIDVGQADCILLEYGSEFLLIDGGNKADSALVVSYLEQQGVEELAAVVCTHAHEDHVGGLPAVLAVYPTRAVYAPTRTYASNIFDDFVYYTDQQGLEITIPSPGDTLDFGEVSVTVLGPVKSYAEANNTSIVLMVEYGVTRFLFTGDMETQAENDMLDYWGEEFDWGADVLKVGHHGSETSTGYRFLNAVMPDYGVISVGKDNFYGHPDEAPLSRLSDAEVILLRTDRLGHVICTTDGQELIITWENQNAQPDDVIPEAPTVPEQGYIGNVNSKKFHLPTCRSLPKPENQILFESYQAAIDAGYTPCGICLK